VTDEWHEDPFKKLDEMPADSDFHRVAREAYEAKIAEAPTRKALMDLILPSPEQKIQRTLANIHALAKHLLVVHEVDAMRLFVGVQPLGNGWRVQVSYSDFNMEVKTDKLDDALDDMLRKLMNHVSRRLEEGTRIVSALGPHPSNRATEQAIHDAVCTVRLVGAVKIVDGTEPGIVNVIVTPERITTLDERDEMCVRIGAVLERVRAVPIRFKVEINGFVWPRLRS
jgi:hypothetical protein